MIGKGNLIRLLAGLLVVVGLPLAGRWLRPRAIDACALDGTAPPPSYRVEVRYAGEAPLAFCCVRCAEMWIENQTTPPEAILIADEASSRLIPADAAVYVRSSVLTNASTHCRIHAFGRRADAVAHAARFGGTVLAGADRPFATTHPSPPAPGSE
jgi:hypothetical protein